MNYCEKIRQSMINGDDDSVVKYIKNLFYRDMIQNTY